MTPRSDTFETAAVELSDNKTMNGDSSNGYYLRWSRLLKEIEMKDSAGGLMGNASLSTSFQASKVGQTKRILKEVSGFAAAGQVLAIMGPSGSGKTSLMNVLSGRSSYNSGTISWNGEPTSAATMKRLMRKVAYVKQADIFFGHLTVRDQLTYTALLRLPSSQTTAQKHQKVDQILKWLRLGKVADSCIYLLSGGEKKRVNIGTELLTDPLVLMLDEPTSGLDSTSAVSLLNLLQMLARDQGKTVLTSIHQPSSAVFRSFDRLLLLSEGCTVYFGSPTDSLDYLRQRDMACPDGYNAADHWMDLLVTDTAVEEERQEQVKKQQEEEATTGDSRHTVTPRIQLQEAWDNEAVAEQMDAALVEKSHHPNKSLATVTSSFGNKYNTGWATQYYVLTHRALKNSRSAIFTGLNLTKSIMIGIAAGLVWFRRNYTEQDMNDIRSYFFFTMSFWVFDSMFTALTAFPSERDVILKERASGSYRLSAYFMAKTTADAPVRLILPFLYMVVSFWMAGLDNRVSVFCGTTGCTLLSVLSGEALGLFAGAAVYDLQTGMTIMVISTLLLMLLGGFFVENIPSFIAWARFLSPFKYAFDSSLQIILDRDVPCDGSGALEELCGGRSTGVATAADVRDFYGMQGSMAFNVGMLLVICFLPRYWAYLALRSKKGGERS